MKITLFLDAWRDAELAPRLATRLPTHLTSALPRQLHQESFAEPLDAGYHWLSRQFGLADGAALAAAFAGTDTPGSYEALPCHWFLARDHIRLNAAPALDLADAQALAEAARAALDGLVEIDVVSADFWRVGTPFASSCEPFLQALNQNVDPLLGSTDGHKALRRMLNVIQTAWWDHPVNQAREAAGLPVINSLWLAGGTAPAPALVPFDAIAGTGPRAAALARWAGLPLLARPDGGKSCLVWSEIMRHTLLHGQPPPEMAALQGELVQMLGMLDASAQIDLVATGARTLRMLHHDGTAKPNLWRRISRLASRRIDSAQFLLGEVA
jgi:hypothetical protein